ncbi:MAG: hydroxyacid dehydrogenase [Clostridia bacterium]|nr:hydroxyacid dehydrogenase [Clostridia bacterium]
MKSIFLCQKPSTIEWVYSEAAKAQLKAIAELNDKVFSKEYLIEHPEQFKETEYIFSTWDMPTLTEDEIRRCLPKLKAVFYAAGSVQFFAKPFLNCGVKVFSAWAANAVPVAEYTVAQIVLSNVGFFAASRINSLAEHREAHARFCNYPGNYGVKVGIIGAGMIGKLVIKMLKAYNMEILVFDPFLPDETAAELEVEKVSLERIFSECNVVSNHLANNSDTVGMLNGELFRKMLPYSTFINTGRGAQVVEKDLIELLSNRPDVTAILDVFNPEPPVEGSPFYTLENCVITPHIAGSWGNEVHRMSDYMVNEFKCYKNGEGCKYEVTAEMLKTMA